jgi:hypothetical protein
MSAKVAMMRDGDGERDDDRAAQVAQEEQQHDHGERAAVEHRLATLSMERSMKLPWLSHRHDFNLREDRG